MTDKNTIIKNVEEHDHVMSKLTMLVKQTSCKFYLENEPFSNQQEEHANEHSNLAWFVNYYSKRRNFDDCTKHEIELLGLLLENIIVKRLNTVDLNCNCYKD